MLGRLEVAFGPHEFQSINGRRNQQLLSLYALNLGRSVSDYQAMEMLWGENIPNDASGALRTYVTRLRKVVDHGAIVRGLDGYRLAAEPTDLDVAVFEQRLSGAHAAARAGRHQTASDEIGRGLTLWHGAPWGALVGWAPADAEITRCEELRAFAEELLAECAIRVGDLDNAIQMLSGLLERDPYRERRCELLMVALSLAGRQAEALRIFSRTRQRLADDLGIDPSPRLRQIELDVLQQRVGAEWFGSGGDQTQHQRVRIGRQPSTGSSSGTIGRQAEEAALDDAITQARAEACLAVVSGEAGIGKTRLLNEFSRRAESLGCNVYLSACYEAEATGAYRAVVDLVRGIVRSSVGSDPAALEGLPKDLLILLPELRDSMIDEANDAVVGDRQLRLFDSITSLLHDAADDAEPIVLIVDDAQWADVESIRLIGHVLRHGATGLLVVLSYRPEELGPDHGLLALINEARNAARLVEVRLAGLEVTDVAELIRDISTRPVGDDVPEAVTIATGGNPLFVTELARTFSEHDLGTLPEQLLEQLPERIENVLSRRIARLGAVAREVFSMISASPGGCGAAMLSDVMPDDREEVLHAIDELLRTGLIVERIESGEAVCSPAHVLFAHASFGVLSHIRQANLHYRLALSLDAMIQQDPDRRLAQVAYHWHAAGRLGEPARALSRCNEAGDLAMERTAYADAAAHFGRALDAAGWCGGSGTVRADLLIKRAVAYHYAGNAQTRERDAEEAFELSTTLDDVSLLARAALVHGGFRSTYGSTNERTTALLSRALAAAAGRSELRARLCSRLAQEHYHMQDYALAEELGEEGLRLARDLGDDETLAAAFHGRVWTMNYAGRLVERMALVDEMISRAINARNRDWEMAGRIWRAAGLLELGDIKAVDRELEQLSILERVVRVRVHEVRVSTLRTTRAMMVGDFDRGMELAQQTHAIGQTLEPANADQVLQAQMIAPLREFGQLGAVLPLVESLAQLYENAPGWRCAAAFVFCEAGEPERGRQILRSLADQPVQRGAARPRLDPGDVLPRRGRLRSR